MRKLRCYIYGAGMEYNRLASYMVAYREKIEILGIVTTQEQKFTILDGVPCIRPSEMQEEMDYIIIAVQKWKDIYYYLKKIGIKDEKILRSSIFYLPNFNLEEYLKLKKNKVSILANSCLGGIVYKELGLKILSPTMTTMCLGKGKYIDFLENYEHYLSVDMVKFNEKEYIPGTYNVEMFVPKGIIDNKLVWHFPHTADGGASVKKWNERRKRINYENIAALMVIQTDEDAERFERLPIRKKIGFYHKDLHLRSVLCCEEWNDKEIQAMYVFNWFSYAHRHVTNMEKMGRIDWIDFLNGGEKFVRY